MSEAASGPGLGPLMRQLGEISSGIRIVRDGITVLAAIVHRMDGTLSGLVNEMRATHAQLSRLDGRVRGLKGG